MIALCGACKPHKFQDEEYGDHMRVFCLKVKGKSSSSSVEGTCTVCGKSKTLKEAKKEKKVEVEEDDGKPKRKVRK